MFPSIAREEGGDWQRRGDTIQAGCLEVGVGKEVRMVLGEHLLRAWPSADVEITSVAPRGGCPLPSVEPGDLQGHLQVGQR